MERTLSFPREIAATQATGSGHREPCWPLGRYLAEAAIDDGHHHSQVVRQMREDSSGEDSLLASQQLGRLGLEVKLDKGFADGTYCVYCEYDGLVDQAGFAVARRTAREYCALLKGNFARSEGYELGQVQDGSRSDDPRRKRDLESTFLWFEVQTRDGKCHDNAIREHFRNASLRAGQVWDQLQAKAQEQRRDHRQEKFRRQLAKVLESPAYAHIDAATRKALLSEVPRLAFPARGIDR